MDINTTTVYERNAAAWLGRKRRALNEGGTSSSKTYSIIQLLVLIASYAKRPLLISVVSESLPHLKRGVIRDFKNILGTDFDDRRYNKTEQVYRLGKSIIEYFPADEPSKMRGGRRDILFINEANNIAYDAYRELDVRTRLFTFLDWNPVSEFWAHEQGLINDTENEYVHSTYLDARHVLPPEVVVNIESNRDRDPNWWNVYGLGLIGRVEGLVYPQFQQEDKLPAGDRFFGLDYGYSTDPTVLTENVIVGDELHSRELIYEKGLTNDMLAVRMDELGVRRNYDEIFDDAAEPKSNAELRGYGFNVKPAPKGQGSVEFGHQKVRQFIQFWTKDSLNCIKEQRNYRYIADRDGKLTDKTTHIWSHGMDSRRYGVVGKLSHPTARMDMNMDASRKPGAGVMRKTF